jgi:hypothetical protein
LTLSKYPQKTTIKQSRKIHLKIPEQSNLKLHQLEKVIRKLKNEQEIYPSTQSRSYSQVESIHLAKSVNKSENCLKYANPQSNQY